MGLVYCLSFMSDDRGFNEPTCIVIDSFFIVVWFFSFLKWFNYSGFVLYPGKTLCMKCFLTN